MNHSLTHFLLHPLYYRSQLTNELDLLKLELQQQLNTYNEKKELAVAKEDYATAQLYKERIDQIMSLIEEYNNIKNTEETKKSNRGLLGDELQREIKSIQQQLQVSLFILLF